MRAPDYEIKGQYEYNEQVKYFKGVAAITEEGYLEAMITEEPDRKRYKLDGSLVILEDVMIIDAMEFFKDDGPRIFYYMEKKIKDPLSASLEGKYVGIRQDYQTTKDLIAEKSVESMTPDTIREMVKRISVSSKDKRYNAVMELKKIKKNIK
ncbi:MAG: hypothetical protein ACP5NW_02295 [Candidatus Woesearchaeota archaeon]